MDLFRTKSVEQSIAETDEPGHRLKKNLGALDLTVFGVGVIIGAGSSSTPVWWRPPTPGPPSRSLRDRRLLLRPGRAVLRGVRLDRARGRQRLHVQLCDLRRAGRVDHRLGPGAGVHASAPRRWRPGFSGYLQTSWTARRWRSRPASARRPTGSSTCRRPDRPARGRRADRWHQALQPHQPGRRRHQARRRRAGHRHRHRLHQGVQLHAVHPGQASPPETLAAASGRPR